MVQQISIDPTISRCKLYLAVVIANLLFMSTGCVLTWPSPVLPKLGLPEEEGSWISSISALGGALGPLLSFFTMPYIGRKVILIANGIIFLISWVVLMAWTNFTAMMIGRFLGGVAVGLSFICVPLYLTEAADDEVRQAATSLTELYIGFGYLVVYGLGPYLTYFQLQICSLCTVILFLIPFVFLPESPHFYISKGEREKAAKSLAWFRGLQPDQVESELNSIQESFSYMQDKEKTRSRLDVIKKKGYRKAFLLGLIILCIQQMSGISVVTSFTEPILSKAGLPFSASKGAILFGVMNLFSSALAPPIVRHFGTKKVLIFSDIIMALSLYAYSGYMYCQVHEIDVRVINLLPVISLVIFNIFFCLGGGPLPWSLVAELSPQEFRGFNSCVITMFTWSVSFVLMRCWAPARVALGDWVIFGFFAICLSLGVVFTIFSLPETKGMSLVQIQRLLAGNKG